MAVVTSMAAAALVGGVVACSSAATSEQTSTGTPSVAAQSTDTAGHDAFAQCMTDNGVPAPPEGGPDGHGPGGPDGHGPGGEPPSGPPPAGAPGEHGTPPAPPGVDQATWDNAMTACQSLAPTPPQHQQ